MWTVKVKVLSKKKKTGSFFLKHTKKEMRSLFFKRTEYLISKCIKCYNIYKSSDSSFSNINLSVFKLDLYFDWFDLLTCEFDRFDLDLYLNSMIFELVLNLVVLIELWIWYRLVLKFKDFLVCSWIWSWS